MISQPMTGKTNEEILTEREELVKKLESQGHEVLDTVFDFNDKEVNHLGVYYMGYSLVAMADADLVVFMDGWQDSRGCRLEYEIAKQYKVPMALANEMVNNTGGLRNE